MSVELSGEITAIGTAVLALFAIFTAVYAARAFRKQSQEVSDQAEQLKFQSKQLKVQSDRFDLQEKQFEEQHKINAEQVKVFELQVAEFRESLAERRREGLLRRSAQASRVSLITKIVRTTSRDFDSGFRLNVTVANGNNPQPVYDVRLYWYSNGELDKMNNPELLGTVLDTATASRDFTPGSEPHVCGALLTFRDATKASWIRSADGDLTEGADYQVPDLMRALFGRAGSGTSSPHIAPDAGQ
jgi:hypothetical protein